MLKHLTQVGLLSAMVATTALAAAPAQAFTPTNPECIAPANPGGGWDFICRQVSKLLSDQKLVPGTVQVTNMAGGGGGVAYAHVHAKRYKDDNLIVAASSGTTTRLAQGAYPGNTKEDVRWLASIGTEYGVIAVKKDSPVKTLPELMDKIKADPTSVAISGGSSVGGYDHLKVLIAARAAGIKNLRSIKYVAFDGGGEAITQLLAGSVQAFSGDLSEVRGFLDSGDVRVLAVLAPERLEGKFSNLPTAREQGIDALGANWRGLYAPGGMSDDAFAFWTDAIKKMTASPEWKKIRAASGLEPLDQTGDQIKTFVYDQIQAIHELSQEIGLIK